jgi:hypothetical protein
MFRLRTSSASSAARVHSANIRRTENNDIAFESTLDPRLDLYFKYLIRHTSKIPEEEVVKALEKSWSISPVHTVQLIFHARDCRHGKGERDSSILAMLWLGKVKPETYQMNLKMFIKLGYFKDLLILDKHRNNKNCSLHSSSDSLELRHLAEVLMLDECALKSGKPVTLAAKWAPSEGKKYDSQARKLAKILYHGSFSRMKKYRELLSRLRAECNIVERQLCAKDFENIDFEKLPSVAQSKLKDVFRRHCKERYDEYLEKVKEGKSKINTTTLHPHQILEPYLNGANEQDDVIELMWRDILEKTKECGHLTNAVAICDVSGSMCGRPMNVCISLGLMVASLSGHGKVITFDTNPELVSVDLTSSVKEQVEKIQLMNWGGSTDFVKSMELLLENESEFKEFPQLLFVFSDMQFNQAFDFDFEGGEKSSFERVKEMYAKRGRELPTIVFWNLRSSMGGVPVTKDENGVFLLSGYSHQTLKWIMKGEFTLQNVNMLDFVLENISDYDVDISVNEI